MKLPTLNQLTSFLEHLDTCDEMATFAERDGVITTAEARMLMNRNAQDRAIYLNQAFQMAHVAAHAEKVERELRAAREARNAA